MRSAGSGTSLPITAAACNNVLATSSRSIRAARIAWTVAGTPVSSTGLVSR